MQIIKDVKFFSCFFFFFLFFNSFSIFAVVIILIFRNINSRQRKALKNSTQLNSILNVFPSLYLFFSFLFIIFFQFSILLRRWFLLLLFFFSPFSSHFMYICTDGLPFKAQMNSNSRITFSHIVSLSVLLLICSFHVSRFKSFFFLFLLPKWKKERPNKKQ